MLQQYRERSVTNEELDRLLALTQDRRKGRTPELVRIKRRKSLEDSSVHEQLVRLFVMRYWDTEDEWRRNHCLHVESLEFDGWDLLTEASLHGVVLGTVVHAPDRDAWVVELDWEACKLAAAYTILEAVPQWVMARRHGFKFVS
jgi:hypothetical protein